MGQALGLALDLPIHLVKKYLTAYSDESWGCNAEHIAMHGSCPKGENSLRRNAGRGGHSRMIEEGSGLS